MKKFKKSLAFLAALSLAASTLITLPASAAQADFCGKVWQDEWSWEGLPLHADVAICPNKLVLSGTYASTETGSFTWPEGSFTVTGLTWEEIDFADPEAWLDDYINIYGYTSGYMISGTYSEVTGGAAGWEDWTPVIGETFQTFLLLHETGITINLEGQDFAYSRTYDCTTPVTTGANPKTSDIDVVTIIATSALAILAIAGSVLVLKKQRA